MTPVDRLIADAEYVVRSLRWCNLRRGDYLTSYGPPGGLPTCCLVGAAALLSATEEDLENANADPVGGRLQPPPGEYALDARLEAKYGLTPHELEGLVDGFDRDRPRRTTPAYAAARRAAEEFAARMAPFFS